MCSTRGAQTRMKKRKVTRRSRASARPALCHNSSHRRYDWELNRVGSRARLPSGCTRLTLLACVLRDDGVV